MDGFKRFSTFSRLLTARSRVVPEIRHRKKYLQTYSALSCGSNLTRKPKKFENNFPLFKYHELQPVSNVVRSYSSIIDQERHVISTFDLYYSPAPIFDIMVCSFKSFLIRLLVDKTFINKEIVESAEVAVKLVSKLIAEKRLDELEGLVTPECFTKLKENIDNWVPINRADIEIEESDFLSTVIYNITLIPEENRRGIEVSLYFFIIKGLVQEIGNPMTTDNIQEYIKKMDSILQTERKKTYAANYRFIKWFYDGKSTDWAINGINHFRVINEYEQKKTV